MADLKPLARSIFLDALQDCSIEHSFDRMLRIDGTRVILDGCDHVDLNSLKRLRILAAGKAATPMLQALLARLPIPASFDLGGILIAPEPPATLPATIQFFRGGHPSPDADSFAGASAALSMLHAVAHDSPGDTLCIFLISGGASAMMELPLDSTISLADTVAFHRALVASGATIVEMNCVRKHFSAVKGGRLAVSAGSARKMSFLVSDVPTAHLDALASGPTIPDPTTIAQCREILGRYSLLGHFLPSVRNFFLSTELPETPKPGELVSPIYKLLDEEELVTAAQQRATALGFHAEIDSTCDDWTYDAAADHLLGRLRQLRREHPRVCVISGGEVSVKLPRYPSLQSQGGRNQHFALYLATQLRPDDGQVAILSAGSDGIDGNSVAAGAVIDADTLADPSGAATAQRALKTFDTSTWLTAHSAAIVTGPTGHNLRDLRILLAE